MRKFWVWLLKMLMHENEIAAVIVGLHAPQRVKSFAAGVVVLALFDD